MNSILSVLSDSYGVPFSKSFLSSFENIQENFATEQWKACGLEAGHFVEYSRRIIEFELFNTQINVGQPLNKFHDSVLKQYEQAQGNDSYRIVIPRILFSIYTIRNKRGVAHTSSLVANKADCILILYLVKWVLSEFIRIKSKDNCELIIEDILQKNISIIWNGHNKKRILIPNLSATDQVIILLYQKNSYKIKELQEMIEYRNSSNFRKIVKKIHNSRLIEYDTISSRCFLSPTGILQAETLLKKYSLISN